MRTRALKSLGANFGSPARLRVPGSKAGAWFGQGGGRVIECRSVVMSIRESLNAALGEAEHDGDAVRLGTLRLIQCAVHERDKQAHARDRAAGCDEAEIMDLLKTMARQREESSQLYEDAGRIEMAERERAELDVIREFLPKRLSEDALEGEVTAVIRELGAEGLRDIGRCVNALRERLGERLDPCKASALVKAHLS